MVEKMSILQKEFEQYEREFDMNKEINRLSTFVDWPYTDSDGCLSTPAKMAEAGFFHCGDPSNPDLVKCYVCGKELDGWEPDDDPWQEHLSHSPQCLFAQYKKSEGNLTVGEMLRVECSRQVVLITKAKDKALKLFKERSEVVLEQMQALI